VDGAFTFTVIGAETGTTVVDATNDQITKDAQGQYIIVHVIVANNGDNPQTWLSTLQRLKAGDKQFAPDDEASFYLGGSVADVNPGVPLTANIAFDVPVGTIADSIELHESPMSPGVDISLK
jgi:hypothetical protein